MLHRGRLISSQQPGSPSSPVLPTSALPFLASSPLLKGDGRSCWRYVPVFKRNNCLCFHDGSCWKRLLCSTVPDPHVHHLRFRMCLLHHGGHQQRLRKCTRNRVSLHISNASVLTFLSGLVLLKWLDLLIKWEINHQKMILVLLIGNSSIINVKKSDKYILFDLPDSYFRLPTTAFTTNVASLLYSSS